MEPLSLENLAFSFAPLVVSLNTNASFSTTCMVKCVLILTVVVLLLSKFNKRSSNKFSGMDSIPWIKPSIPWIGPLHFVQNRDGINKYF